MTHLTFFCSCLHIRWKESNFIYHPASTAEQPAMLCTTINMNINTSWILFLVKVGRGNVHVYVNVTTEVMSIFVGSFPHDFTAESLCSGGFHWHSQTALTQLRTLCVFVWVFTCDVHNPQCSNTGKTYCYVTAFVCLALLM